MPKVRNAHVRTRPTIEVHHTLPRFFRGIASASIDQRALAINVDVYISSPTDDVD